MSFYHTEKGVADYISMADGYDGKEMTNVLQRHLDPGKSVLELGMGPGKDLDLLSVHYSATGSDFSAIFVDRYRVLHPDSDLLQLDAVTINTDRQFDAIYSNKVLHHLSDSEQGSSIERQAAVLTKQGVVLHSFWYGDRVEEFSGMMFYYRDEEFLKSVFSPFFDIVRMERYTEIEDDDSLLLVARAKTDG